MKSIKKLLCIFLALISIFSFNACESKKYPPAKVMNIEKIYDDYEQNEAKAEKTHSGQRYKCTATVHIIKSKYIYVKVNRAFAKLKYNTNQNDFVMSISKDDEITFEGTFSEKEFESGVVWMVFKDVIFVTDTTNTQS